MPREAAVAGPAVPSPATLTLLAPSFHGATTLSALLNNHPDIVSLGDTNPPRVFEDHLCTCGAEIRACPFWVGLRAAMGPFEHAATPAWFPARPRIVGGKSRLDSYLTIAAGLVDGGRMIEGSLGRTAPFRRFRAFLESFAAHVRQASGKRIFVDGEKSLTKFLAGRLAGYRPEAIIHLFRDPRAFAASSIRVGVPAVEAAREWRVHHARLVRVTGGGSGSRVLRLRYEDLTAEPEATMLRVFELLCVPPADVFFRPARDAFWHQTGNRTILKFDGRVRESGRWRQELDAPTAEAVLATAGPLARNLGYG